MAERKHITTIHTDILRDDPYSLLHVGKYRSFVIAVIDPLYDDLHFSHVIKRFEQIKKCYYERGIESPFKDKKTEDAFLDGCKQLVGLYKKQGKLFDSIRKLNKKMHLSNDSDIEEESRTLQRGVTDNRDNSEKEKDELELQKLQLKLLELNTVIWNIEDFVMPIALNMPYVLRDDVPTGKFQEVILREFGNTEFEKNFKLLDYVKLCYINDCMINSVVGPKAIYLKGKAVKLQNALIQYFADKLRANQFSDFSGMDFVKSAIVEACNDIDVKSHESDACRIIRGYTTQRGSQQLHLAGNSSLEALSGFFSKRLTRKEVVRLFSIGSTYDMSLGQRNTVHTMTVTHARNLLTEQEMAFQFDLLWDLYKDIGLPCRAVNCHATQLSRHEFARYHIDVWLHSKQQWLTTSRLSHYHGQLARRLGIKCHIVDSVALDTFRLITAIIEHFQTNTGEFEFPSCLDNYIHS